MNISAWMSWVGGVDLLAFTQEGLPMPNVIVHLARVVHTPVGSAPAGMVFYMPDPNAPPTLMAFVSPATRVGAYFGPNIFAGTPFENALVLDGSIEIIEGDDEALSRVQVAGMNFETSLTGLGALELVDRAPNDITPFHQRVVESVAQSASLKVNGIEVPVIVPPVPSSIVWSPTGIYTR